MVTIEKAFAHNGYRCDKKTEEIMQILGEITEDEIEEYLDAIKVKCRWQLGK